MTTSKKPGVAFWATVVVVVALLYPVSWGPVLYLWTAAGQPLWMAEAIDAIYYPLEAVRQGCPDNLARALSGYANWWIDRAAE